jgi:pectinesterase
VSKDGYGDYTTIGEALLDTSSDVYYIYPGNYTEQVNITRPNIHIYGQTLTPWTYGMFYITLSLVLVPMWTAEKNTVTVSRNMPATIAGSNDLSGTVRVLGNATGTRRAHWTILISS